MPTPESSAPEGQTGEQSCHSPRTRTRACISNILSFCAVAVLAAADAAPASAGDADPGTRAMMKLRQAMRTGAITTKELKDFVDGEVADARRRAAAPVRMERVGTIKDVTTPCGPILRRTPAGVMQEDGVTENTYAYVQILRHIPFNELNEQEAPEQCGTPQNMTVMQVAGAGKVEGAEDINRLINAAGCRPASLAELVAAARELIRNVAGNVQLGNLSVGYAAKRLMATGTTFPLSDGSDDVCAPLAIQVPETRKIVPISCVRVSTSAADSGFLAICPPADGTAQPPLVPTGQKNKKKRPGSGGRQHR